MLERDDVSRLRSEFSAYLGAPRSVFESLSQPGCLLNRRNVLPGLVIARAVLTMQRIKYAEPRLPCGIQNLQHMRDTIICFCNSLQAIPYFASLGNEIIVWIDDKKRCDFFIELQI